MKKNEIQLNLMILGYEDITAKDLTRIIGEEPLEVYNKGEKMNKLSSRLASRNGWVLKNKVDKYENFDIQLSSLLDFIESKYEIFNDICSKYYCEISCGIFIYNNEESTPWIHLNERYNKLNKELNISFDLDLYINL